MLLRKQGPQSLQSCSAYSQKGIWPKKRSQALSVCKWDGEGTGQITSEPSSPTRKLSFRLSYLNTQGCWCLFWGHRGKSQCSACDIYQLHGKREAKNHQRFYIYSLLFFINMWLNAIGFIYSYLLITIVRSLAFLGWVEGPEAGTETRPRFMTACPTPICFSAWKTPQKLLVTQLARHVYPCHLVTTDNQRPETLSLPHGLDPPIKHTTHFSQAAAPWSGGGGGAGCSPGIWILINLSFPHMVRSSFSSTL
jgi:hypothetical protein